jgi:DNA-binding MarR family transcriptional regulator
MRVKMSMDAWELLNTNINFYHEVMAKTETALAKHKLEVKSFFLLAALEIFHHPADLARYLLMPKPTITFLIKKMEAAGYVDRKTVAGDLRKFELQLTQKGINAVKDGREIVTRAFEQHLSKLTQQEIDLYSKLIHKLNS